MLNSPVHEVQTAVSLSESLLSGKSRSSQTCTSSLSTDDMVVILPLGTGNWLIMGTIAGIISQLASLGVAFIALGRDPAFFIFGMIFISLGLILVWASLLRSAQRIFRIQLCHNESSKTSGDDEENVKSNSSKETDAIELVTHLQRSFLLGLMFGALGVAAVAKYL
jgi:hypothetical protein